MVFPGQLPDGMVVFRPSPVIFAAEVLSHAGDGGEDYPAYLLQELLDGPRIELSKDADILYGKVAPCLYAVHQPAPVPANSETLGQLDGRRLSEAVGCAFGEAFLDLDRLAPSGERELARLLRRWLEKEGVAAPSQARLVEFGRQALAAREDSQPALAVAALRLRRYRRRLYLGPAQLLELPEVLAIGPGQPVAVPGLGELEMVPAEDGLRLPASGAWQLRFRAGGERCRPRGRQAGQSLKKLLQEYGVPPWVRDSLPLLYGDGGLAAVADLWICEGFAAGAA